MAILNVELTLCVLVRRWLIVATRVITAGCRANTCCPITPWMVLRCCLCILLLLLLAEEDALLSRHRYIALQITTQMQMLSSRYLFVWTKRKIKKLISIFLSSRFYDCRVFIGGRPCAFYGAYGATAIKTNRSKWATHSLHKWFQFSMTRGHFAVGQLLPHTIHNRFIWSRRLFDSFNFEKRKLLEKGIQFILETGMI